MKAYAVRAINQRIDSEVKSLMLLDQKMRDFPYNCMTLRAVADINSAKPRGGSYSLDVSIEIEPDVKKFTAFYRGGLFGSSGITQNLRVFSSKRGSVNSGESVLPQASQIDIKPGETILFFASSPTQDMTKIRWDYYILPERARLYFSEKAATCPVVELRLTDNAKNVIYSERLALVGNHSNWFGNLAYTSEQPEFTTYHSEAKNKGSYVDHDQAKRFEQEGINFYFIPAARQDNGWVRKIKIPKTIEISENDFRRVTGVNAVFADPSIAVLEHIDRLQTKLDHERRTEE